MLWAACCLGFFGFLREGNFTTSQPFDPSQYAGQYTLVNPTCFKIHTKSSKTDPFKIGHNICVGRGNSSIYPIAAISNFLALKNIYFGIKQKQVA